MATLRDLKGVSAKEIECLFIEKASDIRSILRSGKAATTADNNGAINIWRDDKGILRAEAFRYLQLLESKEFKNLEAAERWTRKWIIKIK